MWQWICHGTHWRFFGKWWWFTWWRVNGRFAMAVVVGGVRRKLLGDGALVVATRVGCAGLWRSFGGVGGWCVGVFDGCRCGGGL